MTRVSSDALLALSGRRCVGTVTEWPEVPANKVVPQNIHSVLVLRKKNKDFLHVRSDFYEEESGETMVNPTCSENHPKQCFDKELLP